MTNLVSSLVSSIMPGWRLLAALSALVLVSACSSEDTATANSTAGNSGYNFDTSLDMARLMTLVLEPASDTLWDSAGWIMTDAGVEELYPTTEDGWDFVLAQAAVIVETGNLLALPGRAQDDDAWLIYSEGLTAAGIMAMESIETRNEEDFFQAGAQIYSVCTACHQAYNPDILNRFDEN